MSATFRKNRRGEVVVRLLPEELTVLRGLPDELRPLVEEPGLDTVSRVEISDLIDDAASTEGADSTDLPKTVDDAVRRRLFPLAYLDPTEEDAEGEWQRMVHPELVRSKLEALSLLAGTLQRASETRGRVEIVLSPEETEAWLGALNDARLALGVVLGVTEDLDLDAMSADDPAAPGHAMYAWLTALQGAHVDALL